MSRFKPYRKPLNPIKPEVDKDRADLTNAIATELQRVVLAYDCYPDKGALTIKDIKGRIWEISIEKSEAKWLAGEVKPNG